MAIKVHALWITLPDLEITLSYIVHIVVVQVSVMCIPFRMHPILAGHRVPAVWMEFHLAPQITPICCPMDPMGDWSILLV